MKRLSAIIIISLLFSCKRKMSHDEALNYYVIVSIQQKEVTGLVKLFSAKLSKFITLDSFKRTFGQYDSIKKDYYTLIDQIDKKTFILDKLASDKENIYLKNSAINYIRDTRNILVNDVFKVIHYYKPVSNKEPAKISERRFFLSRRQGLITDDMVFKKLSEIFRKQYHITDDELIKYNL